MAEQTNESAEGQEKNNGKGGAGGRKFLVLGLIAGLGLGGGGTAGYFLFAGGDETATEPVKAEEAPQPPQKTTFVKLERLSAPLVSNGRVLGYVLLDLSLEVKGAEDELRVAQRLPALRAAFLKEVTDTPIGKQDQPMVIDYDGLTGRLRTVANRELGRETVLRVLVTQSTRL